MKTVNPYYISAVLEPFLFLTPEQENLTSCTDENDEESTRHLIRKIFVPYFEKFDKKSQEIVRNSLGYYLSNSNEIWVEIFNINQPQFHLSNPPEKFFEWLWKELFGDSNYLESSSDEYRIIMDFHAPNLIKRG